MSQYTQNQLNAILDKFHGFMKFLGVNEASLANKPSDKMLVKFENEEVERYWVAFYTAYSFGHYHGRVYQANADAILMTQQINELEQSK